MKGKILTIAGIVLVFGFFIFDSFKNPSSMDPNQVVMVGNDTLGRDWGAQADQRDREKAQAQNANNDAGNGGGGSMSNTTMSTDANKKSEFSSTTDPLKNPTEDAFQKPKLNSDDYSTIQSADGREVITGYSQSGENPQNYETRHQQEKGRTENVVNEPTIIYKE